MRYQIYCLTVISFTEHTSWLRSISKIASRSTNKTINWKCINKKKKTVDSRMNTHDKVENLPFVTLTAMATTRQYMTPFRLGL